MKKIISVLISVIVLISCIAMPSYADKIQSGTTVLTREINIDKYDSNELVKRISDGTISEDEFTKIDIQCEETSECKITTITISELKERKIVQGIPVESYVQQTIATRAAGQASISNPYQGGQNSFTLNYKLYFDKINYNNGNLYKITGMTGSYTNVVGRLSFKKLELYCGASSDAYVSTTQRVGWRSENASRTVNAPMTSGELYSKNVNFNYYYYDEPTGASMGGNATIYYTVSNQTTQHSFTASIDII